MTPALTDIAEHFASALAIIRNLPSPEPKRLRAWWPQVTPEWDAYSQDTDDNTGVLWLAPVPMDVDTAVLIALTWPALVEHDGHRAILFLRAAGRSYRTCGEMLRPRSVSSDTAERWHEKALQAIASRLRGETAPPGRLGGARKADWEVGLCRTA
jgi:hypothetical protein